MHYACVVTIAGADYVTECMHYPPKRTQIQSNFGGSSIVPLNACHTCMQPASAADFLRIQRSIDVDSVELYILSHPIKAERFA
jgi:hypothetical protein